MLLAITAVTAITAADVLLAKRESRAESQRTLARLMSSGYIEDFWRTPCKKVSVTWNVCRTNLLMDTWMENTVKGALLVSAEVEIGRMSQSGKQEFVCMYFLVKVLRRSRPPAS